MVDNIVKEYIGFNPQSVREFLIHHIMLLLFDLQWLLVEEYVPQRIIDELEGMAETSGVDYAMLRRVNVIPELIQCSAPFWELGVQPLLTRLLGMATI